MTTQPTTTIRDLREAKCLSEDKVAAACGLTYSKFVRIQEGSGKTTPEEVAHVMAVLEKMEPGTRKLAGRPFKDAAKQAAVLAARQNGTSVAAAIGVVSPAQAPSPTPSAESAPVGTQLVEETFEGGSDEATVKPKRSRSKGGLGAALKTPRGKKTS